MARKSPIENEPLSKLAELIKTKPEEWFPVTADLPRFFGTSPETVKVSGLKHVSGVVVAGNGNSGHGGFWIRWGPDARFEAVESRFNERFRKAVQWNLLARIQRPIIHYDSTAEALADAVKTGDRTAAKALADLVMDAEGASK